MAKDTVPTAYDPSMLDAKDANKYYRGHRFVLHLSNNTHIHIWPRTGSEKGAIVPKTKILKVTV